MNEPNTAAPKPCSTPHSAPVEWLEEVTKELLPREDQPAATPETIKLTSPLTRHDGWTGEKMAIFCETLAETAVVAEACEAAGKHISGAYALRRRNPYFAAAWDAALTIARERLADTLLARSMEGNIEQIWKDWSANATSSTTASASPSSSASIASPKPASPSIRTPSSRSHPRSSRAPNPSTGNSPSTRFAPATTHKSARRWRSSKSLP